jgi:hypothetical protein
MIRKRTILSLALLASTAACGGGGGGGSSSPAVTGSAPASGAAAVATMPSTDIANPQVSMSADGTATFASGQTAQTVTNENNVLTVHVDGVVDQAFDFTNDTPNTTVFNADNSSFAQIDKVDANGNTVSVIKFNDGSQLDAVTYGIWQTTDKNGNMTNSGAFVQGSDTPADQMPASGTATYAGQAIGTGKDGTGSFTLIGSSNVTADFGSHNVTTNVELNKVGQDQPFVALQSTDGLIANNSNKFAGTIKSSDGVLSGGIQGGFFGTAANQRGAAGEVAGVFNAAGGGTSLNGAFAGAKQ